MLKSLVLLTMLEKEEKMVVFQADIRESTRTRLKLQAVRVGTTMSALTDKILNEALEELEKQ